MRPPDGTPLYVHLPFCVQKCTYCDFYSVAAEGEDLGGTLSDLLLEIRVRAPRRPRTVFLGGGTPSLYASSDLARLLDALDAATGFRASAREVTLECNPESLDEAKARRLLALGVDRLSIGVQSLDPATLALFGRPHDAEQGLEAVRAARRAGFRRVSVDLIHGAPGQDPLAWERELERVLALSPDHVSAYALAFERGTPLAHRLASGELEALDEDAELDLFHRTRAVLGRHGYEAYEVSNFALDGQRCRHNVNYWRNGPYVGVGPSAVSRIGRTRFGNARSLALWRRAARRGFPPAWEETLDPLGRLAETWWLGLRLAEGVRPARARRTAGYRGEDDPAEALARRLGREGWLEESGGSWRLTARGLPVGDAVAARFLELPRRRSPRSAAAAETGAAGG